MPEILWATELQVGAILKTPLPATGRDSRMVHEEKFMSPKHLAKRWHMGEQTLANWRHAGTGPPFVRISNRVLYPVEGILTFEKIDSKWLTQDN